MGRASDKALSLAVSYATFWIHFYVLRLWTKSCAWPFKWNRFSSTYTWYLSCFYVSSRKLVFFFSFDLEHCLEKGWNRTCFSLSLLFNLQLNHRLWCQNAVESRCIISITSPVTYFTVIVLFLVPIALTLKKRPSAKPVLWKCDLFAWESIASHLASLWNGGLEVETGSVLCWNALWNCFGGRILAQLRKQRVPNPIVQFDTTSTQTPPGFTVVLKHLQQNLRQWQFASWKVSVIITAADSSQHWNWSAILLISIKVNPASEFFMVGFILVTSSRISILIIFLYIGMTKGS